MKSYTDVIEVLFSGDMTEKLISSREDMLRAVSSHMDVAFKNRNGFPGEFKQMHINDQVDDVGGLVKMTRIITFINPVWKI